jgi:hypothetical protein
VIDPQNSAALQYAIHGDHAEPASHTGTQADALPTPTPRPQTAAARVTVVSGLKVLLVPQSFRYEEVPQDPDRAVVAGARLGMRSKTASSCCKRRWPPVEVAPVCAVVSGIGPCWMRKPLHWRSNLT